jgi:hypothetical protein
MSGTVAWRFFLKRFAMVRRLSPSTQAAKGASPRNDPIEEKMLMNTSWTISSVSARLFSRFSTKR